MLDVYVSLITPFATVMQMYIITFNLLFLLAAILHVDNLFDQTLTGANYRFLVRRGSRFNNDTHDPGERLT